MWLKLGELLAPQPLAVGFFTNRSEISLLYMIENGFRCNAKLNNPFHPGQYYDNSQAPATVPNAEDVLTQLGY